MKSTEKFLSVIQKISARLRELKENEINSLNLRDFSFSYFKYIEAISKLNRPTFLELSKEMKLSKPTVTIMINKLIETGYVKKTKSPDDKRVYYLNLTTKSEEIINAHEKMFQKFSKEVAEKFDENELNLLITLLNKI